jgi:uncharacterized membrane protein YedE/YeeE
MDGWSVFVADALVIGGFFFGFWMGRRYERDS